MAGSFSLDGIDYGDSAHKCFLTTQVFPLLGKPRVNLMALSAEDGAVSQGSSVGELYFRFGCVIDTDDETDREACLWQVISDLSTAAKAGEATLIFDHWPTKSWQARLIDEIDGELALNGAEFPLAFVAPNPAYTVVAPPPEQ
jgi:hypothetical protein